MTVRLVAPRAQHEAQFLAAVAASRHLHHPWVCPPADAAQYHSWLKQLGRPNVEGFLAVTPAGQPAAVVTLSEIVMGLFKNAYLGYYALEPFAGQGHTRAALARLLTHAFRRLRLHRVEANVQPGNTRSIRLAEGLGFRYEGTSERYLKINGRWRDHERWAITAEEWQGA